MLSILKSFNHVFEISRNLFSPTSYSEKVPWDEIVRGQKEKHFLQTFFANFAVFANFLRIIQRLFSGIV